MNVYRQLIHVAVGIICDPDGAVLITRRPEHVHVGGLWEFPGGKVEAGETAEAGLYRELYEELGIVVQTAESLFHLRHDYDELTVLLDVWRVIDWRGDPEGREGQPLSWVPLELLESYAFPAADAPIITWLRSRIGSGRSDYAAR